MGAALADPYIGLLFQIVGIRNHLGWPHGGACCAYTYTTVPTVTSSSKQTELRIAALAIWMLGKGQHLRRCVCYRRLPSFIL